MRCSADTPTRSELAPTGWMAFCAAVRTVEKREAREADHVHTPPLDEPDARVH
jgi:hypothetical protein